MSAGLKRSQLIDQMSKTTQEGATHTYLEELWAGVLKKGQATLTAGAEDSFSFAFQNPEASQVLVLGGVLYVSAAGEAGAVMDIGSAANATTNGSDLLASVPLDMSVPRAWAFTGVALLDAAGGATDYVTGQIKLAAGTSLAGKVFIFYVTVA